MAVLIGVSARLLPEAWGLKIYSHCLWLERLFSHGICRCAERMNGPVRVRNIYGSVKNIYRRVKNLSSESTTSRDQRYRETITIHSTTSVAIRLDTRRHWVRQCASSRGLRRDVGWIAGLLKFAPLQPPKLVNSSTNCSIELQFRILSCKFFPEYLSHSLLTATLAILANWIALLDTICKRPFLEQKQHQALSITGGVPEATATRAAATYNVSPAF